MIQQYEKFLFEQPEIDAADRETMIAKFEAGLNEAKLDPSAATAPELMQQWQDLVGQLQAQFGLSDTDSERLRGVLEKPLLNPTVQKALEFSRYVEIYGPEKAREWWASQQIPERGAT
ncbi:hypothetical protein WQ56_08875 [Luteimonas sp. FCS-9]|nr:hypothetical protein WQ56_08875 [Luteimonas sp. FCS-9]